MSTKSPWMDPSLAQIWCMAACSAVDPKTKNTQHTTEMADEHVVEFLKRFKWDDLHNTWVKA